jgi:hypothetical protein
MPVFTFEKIPSPIRHASSAQPAAEKPRNVKRMAHSENAGQPEQGKPEK